MIRRETINEPGEIAASGTLGIPTDAILARNRDSCATGTKNA